MATTNKGRSKEEQQAELKRQMEELKKKFATAADKTESAPDVIEAEYEQKEEVVIVGDTEEEGNYTEEESPGEKQYDVVVAQHNSLQQKSPLEVLADKKMEDIRRLNPDFRLDFMNVFTRLKLNSKGQFQYTLSGEDFVLSDSIKARLLAGDYMYQFWGEEGTQEEGTLVCYSKDSKKTSVDGTLCSECPYDYMKCKLRFAMAMTLLEDGEDESEVYNLNVAPTGAYAFADYVKLLSKKYKKGLKEVITNVYTEEKTGKEKSQKYNAVLFRVAK